jgi:lysophospholipase
LSATPELPPGGLAWDQTLELEASDGIRLRGALWRGVDNGGSRGLALFLPGRTEFLEKCANPAAKLVGRGFSVASLDWRGQGHSQRLTANPMKGHVGKFTDYHLDLAALLAHPAVAGLAMLSGPDSGPESGPVFMLAHSMGATIGLGAIKRGLLAPRAVVLSAPMMGIELRPSRRLIRRLTLHLATLFGKLESWPPFEALVNEPYFFTGYDGNVMTGDREMFAWVVAALRRDPELQLGMPTLGWMRAAFIEMAWLALQRPLECPGLCLLGSREQVVVPGAVRAVSARLGLELVTIENARHEVLIEAEPMCSQAWAAIDRFLKQNGI